MLATIIKNVRLSTSLTSGSRFDSGAASFRARVFLDVPAKIFVEQVGDGVSNVSNVNQMCEPSFEIWQTRSFGWGCILKRVTLAGNTVMERIARGIEPDSIGMAPYEPATRFRDMRTLCTLPAAANLPQAYVAPCVAGYVGGGSLDGWCEVYPGKRYCIWYKAYHRLLRYDELWRMTSFITLPSDWKPSETGAWSNYLHDRDNAAKRIPIDIGLGGTPGGVKATGSYKNVPA